MFIKLTIQHVLFVFHYLT